MSQITTHVLNTATGTPAAGVEVALSIRTNDAWRSLATARTDADGRVVDWLKQVAVPGGGEYQLLFDTGSYFKARGEPCFFPQVCVQFAIDGSGQHYHVPLLLSPFGYSTYRGS